MSLTAKLAGNREIAFDSHPYLVTDIDRHADHVQLLPVGMARERLVELARRQHAANGHAVRLVLASNEVLVFAGGFSSLELRSSWAEKPLLRVGPLAGGAPILPSEHLYRRHRYLAAWQACLRGNEPFFVAPAADADDAPGRRLAAAFPAIPEQLGEILRFLRLAHAEAQRNPLFSPPDDVPRMLWELAAYDRLDEAWRGGWLLKPWRAWMAEIASAAGLFDPQMARAVGRLYSREASQPGQHVHFFGQALGREFPDLFREIDRRTLDQATRETVIGFVA